MNSFITRTFRHMLLRLVVYVARMGETLARISQGRRLLGRSRRRWMIILELILGKLGGVIWIENVAQHWDSCWALVNTIMTLRIP